MRAKACRFVCYFEIVCVQGPLGRNYLVCPAGEFEVLTISSEGRRKTDCIQQFELTVLVCFKKIKAETKPFVGV